MSTKIKTKTGENIFSDDLLAQILVTLPTDAATRLPAKRAAKIRQSLLNRVDKQSTAATGNSAYELVRSGEGDWITFAPNVAMKVLHDDGVTRSWLARFGPGGLIPAHVQSGDEEAVILEGWCWLDDVRIDRGDYHFINKDQRHGTIHSPEGCLIFVRSHSGKRHASQLAAVR